MTGRNTTRRSPPKAAASGTRPSRAKRSAADLEARIAWLEGRLLGGDGDRPSTEYMRAWFAQIMPPEATRHFMTAWQEQLLGVRALVDHWIGRLDPEKKPATRETIRIE